MSHERIDRFTCDRCQTKVEIVVHDKFLPVRLPDKWADTSQLTQKRTHACPFCVADLKSAWSLK